MQIAFKLHVHSLVVFATLSHQGTLSLESLFSLVVAIMVALKNNRFHESGIEKKLLNWKPCMHRGTTDTSHNCYVVIAIVLNLHVLYSH